MTVVIQMFVLDTKQISWVLSASLIIVLMQRVLSWIAPPFDFQSLA